ncbi:MAG: imidazole glycerol phosphate synthase subunit HisF [Oligoflexia bacterium]|nr:imidazole glycerol phosphate synthase subunit HisF [Oligoflexia bacterium]
MLTKRIIPCLDVRDGVVVKGVKFKDHVVLGEILELAGGYRDMGADELVFYDITASPEGRAVSKEWITKTARLLDIPFCVAGGIRSVEIARTILNAGADKISINSPALENPDLINQLVREFGSQCVVIGIDSMMENGDYFVYQYTGSVKTIKSSKRKTIDWVREVQERGAGEIVLNCMNQDGTREGYDVGQLAKIRKICLIPLIASGGAGKIGHFTDVFKNADVDAALAAGIFHRREVTIPDLKKELKKSGIEVRI